VKGATDVRGQPVSPIVTQNAIEQIANRGIHKAFEQLDVGFLKRRRANGGYLAGVLAKDLVDLPTSRGWRDVGEFPAESIT
jgi:hypothetical protein